MKYRAFLFLVLSLLMLNSVFGEGITEIDVDASDPLNIKIKCLATSNTLDCIGAYVDDGSHTCDWGYWEGNYAVFNCHEYAFGTTHTANCFTFEALIHKDCTGSFSQEFIVGGQTSTTTTTIEGDPPCSSFSGASCEIECCPGGKIGYLGRYQCGTNEYCCRLGNCLGTTTTTTQTPTTTTISDSCTPANFPICNSPYHGAQLITTDDLNLRTCPGNSSLITTISTGLIVTSLGECRVASYGGITYNWYKIRYQSEEGWSASNWLEGIGGTTTSVTTTTTVSGVPTSTTISVQKQIINPIPGKICQSFFYPRPDGHWGVDIFADKGTPILATCDGVIVDKLDCTGDGNCSDCSPDDSDPCYRGRAIWLLHDDNCGDYSNYKSYYSHLDSFSVSKGQHVSRGQEIAKVGNTGWWDTSRSPEMPPHLHFALVKPPYNCPDTKDDCPDAIDPAFVCSEGVTTTTTTITIRHCVCDSNKDCTGITEGCKYTCNFDNHRIIPCKNDCSGYDTNNPRRCEQECGADNRCQGYTPNQDGNCPHGWYCNDFCQCVSREIRDDLSGIVAVAQTAEDSPYCLGAALWDKRYEIPSSPCPTGCRVNCNVCGSDNFHDKCPTDCSAFTDWVYERYGFLNGHPDLSLYPTAKNQAENIGYVVDGDPGCVDSCSSTTPNYENLVSGDLIFFCGTFDNNWNGVTSCEDDGITHVGIYSGSPNEGNFIHASGSGGKVMFSNLEYFGSTYTGAKRVSFTPKVAVASYASVGSTIEPAFYNCNQGIAIISGTGINPNIEIISGSTSLESPVFTEDGKVNSLLFCFDKGEIISSKTQVT
ncbi:MAG: peptidoglycan DD-metalloendopeptidase family protein [Candidatus Aenigmarchaeota archaeon]|nr:peptidoglycan DD-metalloendopeptidase family protein [Candidatus Aenigmarchaeota archaeon]